MRGNPDAWVTLVQWTGYNDPFSRSAFETIGTLLDGPLGVDIRLVAKQRSFEFQDPGHRLARAAIAAHQQGLFWELHDRIFQYDGELDEDAVDTLATDAGLDLRAFHAAIESPEVAAVLDADAALFGAVGASGTPSFVFNGALVSGSQPLGAFEVSAMLELDAMEALIAEGLSTCEALEIRLGENLP